MLWSHTAVLPRPACDVTCFMNGRRAVEAGQPLLDIPEKV